MEERATANLHAFIDLLSACVLCYACVDLSVCRLNNVLLLLVFDYSSCFSLISIARIPLSYSSILGMVTLNLLFVHIQLGDMRQQIPYCEGISP